MTGMTGSRWNLYALGLDGSRGITVVFASFRVEIGWTVHAVQGPTDGSAIVPFGRLTVLAFNVY